MSSEQQLSKNNFIFHLLAISLGILLTIAIVLGFYFYKRNQHYNKTSVHYSGSLTYFHPIVGKTLEPNRDVNIKRYLKGEKIIDYTVKTDDYGRRIVPDVNNTSFSDYAIFFGCSYTMGEGVQDDETFPYYFQQLSKKYKSYIYAHPGYGPQQMLAYSESFKINEQINEKKGLIFYTWPTGHLDRLLGTPRVITWAKKWPYYEKNESGKIIRKGFFEFDRKVKTKIYLEKAALGITNYFFNQNDYLFMCDIIQKSKENLLKQLPNSRFITVAHSFWRDSEIFEEVSKCLKERDIPVIDSSDVFNKYKEDQIKIKGDGHPTAFANKVLAQKVLESL